jgi:hypothetical protein
MGNRKLYEFRRLHEHSLHMPVNTIRREAVRVSLLSIEDIIKELGDWVSQLTTMQN